MQPAVLDQPVVVTFREVERVLTGNEAVPNIAEAANVDTEASPIERATVMAAMGNILKELRKAQDAARANVMVTAPDGPASRLQSLIASGEAASLKFVPLPTGGLEAKFDTQDWFGWATVAWAKLKHRVPHPIVRPADRRPQKFPNRARVAVVGDWGTGLYGAPEIAKAIRDDPDPFGLLLHLGDVYYSGTDNEVKQRFLDRWPTRRDALSRALNSNHEMYSGGEPYFTKILPAFGQEASYFAFQNDNWLLVGLDVAYQDHAIDDEQVDWLTGLIAGARDRKVVLFSHHQLFSHFESQGVKLWTHPGFGAILRSKRIFAWYWGHEHRCSIFEAPDPTFGLLARCIGHSGMPQGRDRTRGLPRATEEKFVRAEWRRSPAQTVDSHPLPSVVVLDGRNDLIKDEEDKFSPHGYAVLTFDGATLIEQVIDASGHVIYDGTLTS
jgi:hypothetical protein